MFKTTYSYRLRPSRRGVGEALVSNATAAIGVMNLVAAGSGNLQLSFKLTDAPRSRNCVIELNDWLNALSSNESKFFNLFCFCNDIKRIILAII